MTQSAKLLTGIAIGAVAIFALVTLIDVDVDGDVEVPGVEVSGGDIDLPNVETSGGEMPEVEVDTADVEVETREETVEVPTDIEVETEEETVTYPTVDMNLPEEETEADPNASNETRYNSE